MDRRSFLVAATTLAAGAGMSACAPVYVDAPPGPPPPWHYDYYYYPGASVYFHLYSGTYYWRDGRTWISAQVLPHHIYLDHRIRRTVVIRDREPHRHWHKHREQYRRPRDYRPHPRFDRDERVHNRRRHEEYRRRRH